MRNCHSNNCDVTSRCNDADDRRRIALTLAYDGAGYAGFQLQANAPTIQGELETAIARMTGETIRIRGASRTDAGAHAGGQVVDFLTRKSFSEEVFRRGINHHLPEAIRILTATCVPQVFHSRRSAVLRRYRYCILNHRHPSPLLRHSHHHVAEPLNVQLMQQAASSLIGIRDFRQISTGHPENQSAIRRVSRWDIYQNPTDDLIIINCAANGFLRHQIRRANAILVEIGRLKQPVHAMAEALAGRQPFPGQIAALPAHGLCLVSVHYPEYDDLLKVNDYDETH